MDWKEQLPTLLAEEEVQTLDVRLICIKDKEKWFLKRLRAIVFHSEPSIPEQVCYSSYLFLRRKMSASDFLQLLSDLTTRSTLPQEELEKLSYEEKLKKFSFNGQEIFCEFVNVVFSNHSHGNSRWGLGDYTLPTWNFGGNLYPDPQESYEPLIASDAKYFPKPIDGQAWYLYEKALQSLNDSLPPIEISIEDDRAYFKSIDFEEEASILRCRCEGKLLSESLIRLYTNSIQVEDKQAANEIVFRLQDHPKIISLALTYRDTLLDRRDMDLAYPQFGIPRDVNIIARSLRPGGGLIADPTPAIEKIAQADPSNVATIAAPHLELVNSYYLNTLRQSQQSFFWALIGGGIGIAFFIVSAFLIIFRQPANSSYLGPAITALAGGAVEVIAGIMLKLYGSTSNQAAAYHVRLDRIQRFFIANSACEGMESDIKYSTRAELIRKLMDLSL